MTARRVAAWTLGLGVVLLAAWAVSGLRTAPAPRREIPTAAPTTLPTSTSTSTPAVEPTAAPLVEISAVPELPLDLGVDFRLWSPKRVRAYQARLRERNSAPLAVLRIPSIDLEVPVLEGTDDLTLDRAVGRIAGTARVGERGNLGIAGHRDGFFRGLKDVTRGAMVELEIPGGARLAYTIRDIRIVRPDTVEVLDPTTEPSVTLVTCYPFYHVGSAPQRYIVRASREKAPQATAR